MNLAINSDNSNRSISQKSKSWRIGLRAGIYSYIVQAFLLLFFLLVVTPFLNEISFEPMDYQENAWTLLYPVSCESIRGWVYLLGFSFLSLPFGLALTIFFSLILSAINKIFKQALQVIIFGLMTCLAGYVIVLILVVISSIIVAPFCPL